MDISQISSAASMLQSQQTGSEVGISVLKKALQVQSETALQLINSVAQPQQTSSPTATLGNNIDVKA